ncbi:PqiC family protein [Alteromonas sp. P256]|uniref:PqiC family protein n=1 Tax=Alteromonas sp. P256 TaxID=3117399 RepID=UPI002FE3EA4A
MKGQNEMKMTTELQSKTRRNTFALVMASLLFALSGCTSTQSSLSYYLLHSAVSFEQPEGSLSSPTQSVKQGTTLLITSITLPDYLKHRGLVYQVSDTNLHISTTHLWAEPFEEGLRKTLRDQLTNDNLVVLTNRDYQGESAVELSIHISDFVSTFNGNVVLKGHFIVSTQQPEKNRYPFFIETTLKEDGFSASVIAMRKALAVLSTEIAESARAN